MRGGTDPEWGEPFGQEERLTTRLRGLVRNYPKGVGILKEFIQNADDAGATKLEVVIDWREHSSGRLPLPAMAELQGPAMLVSNDETFSDEDLESIQNIGHGGKIRKANKTGRFGLGFNAVYNVTDFPCLLTRDQLCLFDPHRRIVAPHGSHSRGRKHRLDPDLWSNCPDLLLPFTACGLQNSADTFPGTIFRLPLRTPEQASWSEIRNEPFTKQDVYDILEQLHALGGQVLLFLKHLLSIGVAEIDSRGIRRNIFRIETANPEEVQSARDRINHLAAGETPEVLDRLQALQNGCCSVPFEHQIRTTSEHGSRTQTWRVVSGMYCGAGKELLTAARQMLEAGEKALPWAGAAARVVEDAAERKRLSAFDGHVYCFLPLPQQTPLPFHINGFFDLDDSRHNVTAEDAVLGRDKVRSYWNEQLVTHAVSRACADLIESLKTDIGADNPALFYQYWPDTRAGLPPGLTSLCPQIYRLLWQRTILCANVKDRWVQPSAIRTLPPEQESLREPLLSEIVMPTPELPSCVVEGFTVCGGLPQLTPAGLRDRLRMSADLDKPLEATERRALSRREWVIAMLEFCLSDGKIDQMRGVPLALHLDGVLHAFGYVEGGSAISESVQRGIFAQHPEWFLAPDLLLVPGLQECSAIQLAAMTVTDVIRYVGAAILKTVESNESYEWHPSGPTIPNAEWLSLVYGYLADCCTKGQPPEHDALCALPLVPDGEDRLWPMGSRCTPLLADDSAEQELLTALRSLGVQVVHAQEELLTAMRRFLASWQGDGVALVELTPGDLVDSLEWVASREGYQWPPYQKELHHAVLDFLADEQCKEEFTECRLQAIRKFKLFPTSSDHVVVLEDTVFIPTNYQLPSVVEGIPLLRLGQNRRWAWLLKAIGVEELDRATLLIRWLLPRYGNMPKDQQVEALKWIRDFYAQILAELEEQPEWAVQVKAAVATCPLVHCSDKQLHPAANVYEPFNDLVQQVLGSAVPIPDMKVYSKLPDLWLDFFRSLGMADTPRARDLSAYIMTLTEQWSASDDKPKQQLRRRLRQTLEHVQSHWSQLAMESIGTRQDGEAIQFSQFLRDTAWLPSRTESERGHELAGFRAAEDRLYCPGELHPPRSAPLIASQLPVLAFAEPSTEVNDALGFPKTPPLTAVLDHMDVLLGLVEEADSNSDHPSVESAFRSIYMHLGLAFRDEMGSEGNTATEASVVDGFTIQSIRTRFADRPCICDRKGQFWLPRKAFKDHVPEFGELRGYITITNPPHADRGLTILGRRPSVEPGDMMAFLDDLAATLNGQPVPEAHTLDIRRVLQRLAVACQEDAAVVTAGVQVLTAEGQLVPDHLVLVDDAPWLEHRLSRDLLRDAGLSLADPLLPDVILVALRLRRLSQCVRQRLTSNPRDLSDAIKQTRCRSLQQVMRSGEFREGVRRLIRQQRRVDALLQLGWLRSVLVKLVDLLPTQLYIQGETDDIVVGEGDGDFFYDSEPETIYLAASTEDLIGSFIAKAINERLRQDDLDLGDLADLEKIILSSPERISQLLSRLHVPVMPHQEQLSYEPADPAEAGMEILPESAPDSETYPPEAGDAPKHEEENSQAPSQQAEAATSGATGGSQDAAGQTGEDDSIAARQGDEESLSSGPKGTAPADPNAATSEENETQSAKHEDASGVESPTQGAASAGQSQHSQHGKHAGPGPRRAQPHPSANAGAGTTPVSTTRPMPAAPRPRKGRVVTYVVPEGQADRDPNPGHNDADEPKTIGDRAVELVLAYERRAGRKPQKMAHNNPGYDVISRTHDTNEQRYIEVKGISGEWQEDGVALSARQFETAQEWKDSYWVYVVEYCCDPKRARIHPIQDPARRVTQYRLDSGWMQLADRPVSDLLAPGVWLMIQDRGKAIIREVETHGAHRRLTVKFQNGGMGSIVFNPSTMKIVSQAGA